jgi:hypothetical protein
MPHIYTFVYISLLSATDTCPELFFSSLTTVTDSIYTKQFPREGKDREHIDKGR